jgi:4-hydroxyphenylacetate 3-hydroxylase, reductase component
MMNPNRSSKSEAVETGKPSEDSRAFRRCLGQFATGVTIVTAQAGGDTVGVTANSFTSVSIDPPLVLWSLQSTSSSFDVFMSATHFAINVLAADQIELSQRFAKSGPTKFDGFVYEEGAGGAPLVPGVCAVFECRREIEHKGGDHVIMIGRVERFTRFERSALAFEKGRYAAVVEHPAARSPANTPQNEASLHRYFTLLLNRAYNRMRVAMEDARRHELLELNESRILSAVATYPDRSLDALLPITFLGQIAAEDALISLSNKGYLVSGPTHTLTITPRGSAAIESLFRNTLALEEQLLSSIPDVDLKVTERTLRAVIGSDAFSQ